MSRSIDPNQMSAHPADDEPVARALECWRQLPTQERQAWLDELDRRDRTLASEVRSLVGYLQQDDFLSHRASNFVLAFEAETESDLAPGKEIGPYRLLNQLGSV